MRHLRHLACITVMLCSMIFGGAAAAENITLAVSPANVAIGDTVTVTVGTNAATAFVFWQVQLGFDSSKVQLATQATGSFATFTADSRPLATINSSQYVTIGGDSAGTSLTGSGTLAVFTFTATANGSAAYNLITYNASSQPLGTALVDPSFSFRMPAYSGSPASVTIAASATAPAITTQPGAASVTVGQTATFTVAASGSAPLTYQWQKNGTAISGATLASYTTPAMVIGDNAATFRAVVTNSAGTATSNAAILTVTAAGATAPAITAQPAATSVTVGQTATFTVAASGSAPLTYQWQKNGTAISGATLASYTTPAMVIGDNAATFRAVVTNSAGTATSTAAILTVTAAAATAPAITTQPTNKTVTVGETANFSVVATGTPGPTYQWQKNDADISGATGTSYMTPATVSGDNGATFRCVATNSAGSTISGNAILQVQTSGTGGSVSNETENSSPCGFGSGIGMLLAVMMLLRARHLKDNY